MPVTIPVRSLYRLTLLLVLSLGAACSVPEAPQENQYQYEADSGAPESEPVRQLHNQALAAINESEYQQAIDYLQRAIKIEPRDGRSWYYLADAYWRQGKLERCLEMIERSQSYASGDDWLGSANKTLKAQCQ
jgi:cytochrome c-type biogenesis protein CcmH/NrfG